MIISNHFATVMKQEAIKNRVLLLDREDIMDLVDLIIENQLSSAKLLFSNKLKVINW